MTYLRTLCPSPEACADSGGPGWDSCPGCQGKGERPVSPEDLSRFLALYAELGMTPVAPPCTDCGGRGGWAVCVPRTCPDPEGCATLITLRPAAESVPGLVPKIRIINTNGRAELSPPRGAK